MDTNFRIELLGLVKENYINSLFMAKLWLGMTIALGISAIIMIKFGNQVSGTEETGMQDIDMKIKRVIFTCITLSLAVITAVTSARSYFIETEDATYESIISGRREVFETMTFNTSLMSKDFIKSCIKYHTNATNVIVGYKNLDSNVQYINVDDGTKPYIKVQKVSASYGQKLDKFISKLSKKDADTLIKLVNDLSYYKITEICYSDSIDALQSEEGNYFTPNEIIYENTKLKDIIELNDGNFIRAVDISSTILSDYNMLECIYQNPEYVGKDYVPEDCTEFIKDGYKYNSVANILYVLPTEEGK